MTDYKNTLNLPKTAFPMKANLAQREPKMLQHWNEIDLYAQRQQLRQVAEKYILHDGPPYANGAIHLGHAVNKILKDIVCKSKFHSGYATPYVPGWDCHGLPIEINVEKKLGKPGVKVSAKKFRQACRDYAEKQMQGQREDFKRLGVLGEWDNPYLTMNYTFEANVMRAFKAIVAKNYLVQGFRPIHWCFACQSSLAEAEVEYQTKTSPSIDVRFSVLDEAEFLTKFKQTDLGYGDISVVIWTTTPWTLPANYAVALHPELEYALVQVGTERLLLAAEMVESIMQRYAIEDYRVLANAMGSDFSGLLLQHPFLDRTSLLVLGEHVTTDAGTGAVHTAPAHGEDDFRIGKEYDLPIDSPVQANGVFKADTPYFAGEHVFKANDHIIKVLDECHKLVKAIEYEHSYPHCWRHKTPVIFRATPQWFINLQTLSKAALASLNNITWHPAWGEGRMAKMLEGRPDWCISRQRVWGVPLPLFTHKDTQALHPNTVDLIEQVALKVEQAGVEAWFELDKAELLGADADDYVKANDVLDVWFDSGVTHYCVLEARDYLHVPADLYLEGSDQYRGWFQSSLLASLAIEGIPPYRNIMTYGFTVDGEGRKMSKSIGNVIAPDKVIKTLGVDIIRLWAAATDNSSEMSVSDEILKRNGDTYRRIRNTARFLLSNLHDFNPAEDSIPVTEMVALDRWIVAYAKQLQAEIISAYDQFSFHVIVQKIHHFCSIELGSFYLDIIKDRQYTCKTDGIARRSAQTAMYHIIEALVRWIAPILSFTADEIWSFVPGERSASVHLEKWYQGFNNIDSAEDYDDNFWQQVMRMRDEVNKVVEAKRNDGIIGSALDADVEISVSATLQSLLKRLADELRFVLITLDAIVLPETNNQLTINVKVSTNKKCERCWQRRADVDNNKDYPGICSRCVDNIAGVGEVRHFA